MPAISMTSAALGYGRTQRPQASSGTGTSSNDPGISAVQIYNAGNTSNGWYWIKTSTMPDAKRVYCNMTDSGGGWMLVSYNGNKQNATASLQSQWYPVAWSNGQGTLSGQFAVNAMDLWYNNGSNQCTSAMRLGSLTINDTPILANSYIGHTVTYTSNANKLSLTTASGVAGTGVLSSSNVNMPCTWTALKGYTSLTTYSNVVADSDWLYNAGTGFYWLLNQSITGTSRGGSGLDIGGWMRTSSKDTWGLSNVASNASSQGTSFPGQTVAIYIK
jgi:hypothetical protein